MRNRKKNIKPRRKIDKTTADIMAGKQMIIDSKLGYEPVIKTYEEISDKLCREKAR